MADIGQPSARPTLFQRAKARLLASSLFDAIRDLPGRVRTAEARIADLERTIDFLIEGDAEVAWLCRNRHERMDATLDLFPQDRRAFHLARYEFACQRVASLRVADIACGTGYGTELLRTRGMAAEVIGIDVDRRAIGYATRHHNPAGAAFVCCRADRTELADASLDVVVSFETIEHVPDADALLGEFRRVLKPGRTLVISTPNDWGLSRYHVRSWSLAEFRDALLRHSFEVTDLYNQNSGSVVKENRNQPAGMVPTTEQNHESAECYIAVCSRR